MGTAVFCLSCVSEEAQTWLSVPRTLKRTLGHHSQSSELKWHLKPKLPLSSEAGLELLVTSIAELVPAALPEMPTETLT